MLIYNTNDGTTRGTCGTGAGGISVSAYIATAAPTEPDGYIIPTARSFESGTPLEDIATMVAWVALALGQNTLSQNEYKKYRKEHPDQALMGDQNVRRAFGTWNAAVRAAGLTTRESERDYNGLSEGDIVIWLAHWLRHFRSAGRGQVTARVKEYTTWVKANPSAPSTQLVIEHGFSRLLEQAARMEQTMAVLPTPKRLSGNGRSKASQPSSKKP